MVSPCMRCTVVFTTTIVFVVLVIVGTVGPANWFSPVLSLQSDHLHAVHVGVWCYAVEGVVCGSWVSFPESVHGYCQGGDSAGSICEGDAGRVPPQVVALQAISIVAILFAVGLLGLVAASSIKRRNHDRVAAVLVACMVSCIVAMLVVLGVWTSNANANVGGTAHSVIVNSQAALASLLSSLLVLFFTTCTFVFSRRAPEEQEKSIYHDYKVSQREPLLIQERFAKSDLFLYGERYRAYADGDESDVEM